MKLAYKSFNLPFKHPFTISKGTKTHQPTLVVALTLGNFTGYGEASAISYYDITVEKMIADLERKKMFVEKFAFTDPERFWHYLHHLFPQNNFLICALDMAGWDLFGKMKGKQLHSIWNTEITDHIQTDFTIGIDSIPIMLQKMKEQPWPIYKIKLGTDNDIEIVRQLRASTEATIRIDANAAWSAEEALKKIEALDALKVELVEQPLAKDDWEGMKLLYQHSPIPLFADESCVVEQDVEKCVNHFHGINIKLTKCSGITPAKRMINQAKNLGLKVMMGSMNESSIGSAAIAQFLPQLDYVDMDGPLLLNADLANGLTFNDAYPKATAGNGLGIIPNFSF